MAALITEDTVVQAFPAFADVAEAERARRILAASASIEAYVGRPLALATRVEVHRPGPTRLVYLGATPVASVTSVMLGPVGSQTAIVDYSLDDPETGVLEFYRSFASGFRYPDRTYGGDPRAGSLHVTYEGGYAVEDMPADIVQASILAVMSGSETLSSTGGGIYASEQLGEYSYRREATGSSSSSSWSSLSPAAIGLLRRYRRIRFS